MVVIPTGNPVTDMIVVDVVAHGGKEKDGCFKVSKRRTFVIKVSQRYWRPIKSRSLVALRWQLLESRGSGPRNKQEERVLYIRCKRDGVYYPSTVLLYDDSN